VTEIGLGMHQRFLVCRKVFRALKGFKKDKKGLRNFEKV